MTNEHKQELADLFGEGINQMREGVRKYQEVMRCLKDGGETDLIRANGARGEATAKALADQFRAMADDLVCSDFYREAE